MSAGSAIQEAAAAAAARRGGGGGQEGDFGLGTGAHGRALGNLEILSDTQGVDFGPYLQRILQDVRENWYRAIPESAEMKKGKLQIEFAITKDGKVADMRLVAILRRCCSGSRGLGRHHRFESISAAAQRFHRDLISRCDSASSTTPTSLICSSALERLTSGGESFSSR